MPAKNEEGQVRVMSTFAMNFFLAWTAFFWGIVVLSGALFYMEKLDFTNSGRIGLYSVSVWLNGWLVPWWFGKTDTVDARLATYHDALMVWMLSYGMTNLLWEVPWVLSSPVIFKDIHTVADLEGKSEYMRESLGNMFYWVMAAFGAVDLRTVNHSGTFYAVEFFCFTNVASTVYFYFLNKKRSIDRYLVPVIFCGQPIAATFIFTFSEVFDSYANMPGGVADTLLALVWTQYQYFFFPMFTGAMGVALLRADWRGDRNTNAQK